MPGTEVSGAGESKLRVDGRFRTDASGYRSLSARGGAGEAFAPEAAGSPSTAAAAAPVVTATGIEALLALQAADDPLLGRRKAVRRGRALLDTLEEVRADLLTGRVSEGRLNQLLALIAQARERTVPGLDALMDEIELRARVELAKLGYFGSP